MAAKMNYAPNPHASSLRRSQGEGVVLITAYEQSRITALRNQAFVTLGRPQFGSVRVMVRMPDESLDDLVLKAAATHPLAIVVAGTGADRKLATTVVEGLAARRIAIVAMDQSLGQLDRTLIRRGIGAYQATRLLLSGPGGGKPLFFSNATLTAPDDRVAGIMAAFSGHPTPLDARDLIPIPAAHGFSYGCGYSLTRDLVASRSFDGLFCYNDEMAVGALKALAEAGVRVPEEVKVVGFDDLPLAGYTTPPLTTVAQPVEEVAHAALALLTRRLADPDAPARRECFETRLVVRESAAPAARSDLSGILEIPDTIRQRLH